MQSQIETVQYLTPHISRQSSVAVKTPSTPQKSTPSSHYTDVNNVVRTFNFDTPEVANLTERLSLDGCRLEFTLEGDEGQKQGTIKIYKDKTPSKATPISKQRLVLENTIAEEESQETPEQENINNDIIIKQC